MSVEELTRVAIERGNDQAVRVLASREEALAARAEAIEGRRFATRPEESQQDADILDESHVRLSAGVGSSGNLVAEGDSWFDYPWADIIQLLEDVHGFDVESVAHKGDTIEDMAYSAGQLETLTRRLEKLLRRNVIPRAILLSGGGNDVAGADFRMLLNHEASPVAGLNQRVLSGVIDERIRFAYATIIAGVTHVCESKLQRKIPILLHGYDYPVPDGQGFWGGWYLLPGPWLEPGFRSKGYSAMERRLEVTRELIDKLNLMLQDLATQPLFDHVKYVDLRGTLATDGASYKRWWDNELHPSKEGFRAITARLASAIPW